MEQKTKKEWLKAGKFSLFALLFVLLAHLVIEVSVSFRDYDPMEDPEFVEQLRQDSLKAAKLAKEIRLEREAKE